jgi:hypothetical protein
LRGKEGTQVSLFVVQERVGTIVTLVRRHVPELELAVMFQEVVRRGVVRQAGGG